MSENQMTSALIMAGGRSERMRSTFGPQHKALVRVLGVPMLERNLCSLLSAGFRDITVAISAQEKQVENYIQSRGQTLASAVGAILRCYKEKWSQGTIGAAGQIEVLSDALLVVNVDNLTALDLSALVCRHLQSGAALTIATHVEPFQIPFGELALADGRVTAYTEKPVLRIRLSSGTYVLGSKARELIPRHRRADLPQLVSMLLDRGDRIAAFEHEAAWIDINDAGAVERAEELVKSNVDAFERWRQKPSCKVASLFIHSHSRFVAIHRPTVSPRYPGTWDIPSEPLRQQDGSPLEAILAGIENEPWLPQFEPQFLASFDDLDGTTRQLIRHHVFVAHFGLLPELLREKRWNLLPLDTINSTMPLSSPLERARAIFKRS